MMAASDNKDHWSDIIRKLEESVAGIKKNQLEAEVWKQRAIAAEKRALNAENLNEQMEERFLKSKRIMSMWKNRVRCGGGLVEQPSVEDRNPAEEDDSRARSSSRRATKASRDDADGSSDNYSTNDSHLLDLDDDSCTYLVSDQEESTMSELCVVQGKKSIVGKKVVMSERRRSIKGNRLSIGSSREINKRPNKLYGKSNSERYNRKKKKNPTPGNGDSSEDDSSVEAMNILNGYLELKGKYDLIE